MKTTPESTAWARFLTRQREVRGWSQVKAHEELHERLGLSPKSRASYIAMERGRLPDPDQQRAIIEYYGSGPLEADYQEPLEATETADTLVAAIHAQTEAINALVARLDVFVGPLGDVVADLLREQIRAATDRHPSNASAK